jgi:hypothetical protein
MAAIILIFPNMLDLFSKIRYYGTNIKPFSERLIIPPITKERGIAYV